MPATRPGDRKLTYEDYCRIPEDGMRHEIIDGEHFVTPAPLNRHQRVLLNLTLLLGNHLDGTELGELRVAPFDVRLAEHSVVQPDLLVVLARSFERFDRRGLEGAPELAIEILSESNRAHDQLRKRRLYARSGVCEYWIVDPETERVEVYRREAGGDTDDYDRPLVLSADRGDILVTELLPGLGLSLVEVFDPGPAERARLAGEGVTDPEPDL